MVARLAADARTASPQGDRVGILAPEEDLLALAPVIAAAAAAGRVEVRPYGSQARPGPGRPRAVCRPAGARRDRASR